MAAKKAKKAKKRAAKKKPIVKRKRGGQSKYTRALHESICEWVRHGHVMEQWLVDNNISRNTITLWCKAHPAFDEDFARAKRDGHDAIADNCRVVARTPQFGVTRTITDDEDGHSEKSVEADMLGHRKLIIETDLKLLAKWDRRYGDKVEHEHKGKLDLEALVLQAAESIEKEKSDAEE